MVVYYFRNKDLKNNKFGIMESDCAHAGIYADIVKMRNNVFCQFRLYSSQTHLGWISTQHCHII